MENWSPLWKLFLWKTDLWRIDAFELWCWRRLLRVPWTARRSTQSSLKEINPVQPKGNQSWIFIRRTDAEAPRLWPPDGKNWLIGKDPDAEKACRQEEKGMQRMRWLDGLTDSMDMTLSKLCELLMDRSLVFWSPWDRKESDRTERLNWIECEVR